MRQIHRIVGALAATIALALVAGCGASEPSSSPSTRADPTTTSAPKASAACPDLRDPIALPLEADFTSCAPLPLGAHDDGTTSLVDEHYQVDLTGTAWFTWIDFEQSQQAVTASADVTLPPASATDLPAAFTFICMGPQPSLASYRLGVMRNERAGLVVIQRDAGEDVPREYVAKQQVDPSLLDGTIRVGFTCKASGDTLLFEGTIDGKAVATAASQETKGFAPFDAVGIRFDHSAADGTDRFWLDDLVVSHQG